MIPYIPKQGEYVKVELYGIVHMAGDSFVTMKVKLNEHDPSVIVTVPLVCVEPFDAVKDAVENDFNETN